MNKVRTFFGLGRKPKRKKKENIELPDNFILGSTDQKTAKDHKTAKEDTNPLPSSEKRPEKKTHRQMDKIREHTLKTYDNENTTTDLKCH